MSTPGGPYWQEPPPQYQVDPITGRPNYFQPQQQQPYGGYQGFGMYQPPEPPKPNRTPWILALVAVLVLVGGGVTAFLLLKDDESPTPTAGPTSSSAPTTTKGKPSSPTPKPTTAKPTTSRTPTEVDDVKVDAVTPGFQGVLSYKDKIAYDVPADWKIETPGTVVGFEDNNGKVVAIMHGVTTYRHNACPAVKGSYRGHVGMVNAGDADVTRAAKNGAKLFADGAAINKDNTKAPVAVTEPVPTKVGQGKIDAMMATATMTVNQPGECPSPSVLFTSVAFKVKSDTFVLISYQDQGVADALPPEVLEKIIASVRPYEG
ncbi:putative membrane protein [Alloactinosynnema sp. L-07]|uniref:hypothetical protein n=1 Tax=Alloactinosynnema sp. L-07 TaxID=1653480 RepID=UPI00065EF5E5|nr:hypothetical protein [Alloactinosynnema sp. L-07]CRK58551.1 putative membrane protein [Alloactinosynnema sp. L-07]